MDIPVVYRLPVEGSTNPTPLEQSLEDVSVSILEALLSIVSTVFGCGSRELKGPTWYVNCR